MHILGEWDGRWLVTGEMVTWQSLFAHQHFPCLLVCFGGSWGACGVLAVTCTISRPPDSHSSHQVMEAVVAQHNKTMTNKSINQAVNWDQNLAQEGGGYENLGLSHLERLSSINRTQKQ